MFQPTLLTPTVPRLVDPQSVRDERHEILQLLVLREIEDRGPLTGKEALDAIAALSCSLDLQPAALSVVHDLRDAGFLTALASRPPRYGITPAGLREAERLAGHCWPAVRDALIELNVCLGCMAPRG